jgi:hypothetical protein
MSDDDPIKVIPLSGFDPEGEPNVRVMADGSLYVVFEFMPPTWAEEDPTSFDDFDQQLSRAIGVPVVWEDREFFQVPQPGSDTVARVRQFVEQYRSTRGTPDAT